MAFTLLTAVTKCLACGSEKDRSRLEAYPYPEDHIITDPIDPLMEIDCQGDPLNDGTGFSDFRRVVVCHQCFRKLSPDMWIGKEQWEALKPVTPFLELPGLPE
jgi:hypothetical protein